MKKFTLAIVAFVSTVASFEFPAIPANFLMESVACDYQRTGECIPND
jgi:hypothetical protein